MPDALNSREWATLLWLAVGLVWVLSQPELRSSLWAVVVAFSRPKLVGPVLLMAGYTAGVVALAAQAGLWDKGLLGESALWFVAVGISLLVNSADAVQRPGFFRRAIRRAAAVTVLVEGFVNLYVFSLPVELLLVPLSLSVVLLAAVAETDEETVTVARLLNGLLAAFGSFLIVYVTVRLVTEWDSREGAADLRMLALPIWLTLSVLPFVYALGLYAVHEQTFARLNILGAKGRSGLRAKLALLTTAGLRGTYIADFNGPWLKRLASARSFRAARWVTAEFLRVKRTETGPAAAN